MDGNEAKRKRFADILERCENRWEDAKKELTAVLDEGIAHHDIYLIAAANYWLGVVHFRAGQRAEQLNHALKAASFFAESDDYEMSARSYNLLAVVYTTSGEYLLANDAYQKAYDILKEHPCQGFKITSILNNFSANYFHMGDVEKAIEYAEKSRQEIKEDDPEYYRLLFMLGENLSGYYGHSGNYEKAFSCTELMKEAMEQGKRTPGDESCYYVNLSWLSFLSGDKDRGIEYADKVIALGKVDIGEHQVQNDYEQIALSLMEIPDYHRAEIFIHYLEDYAENTGVISDKLVYYRSKAAYDDAVGDEKGALLSSRALNECYEVQNRESLETARLIQKQLDDAMDEIKELLVKVRENERNALTDGLTGFFNKSGTEKYAVSFCKKGGGLLMIFDLDDFKLVNDIYGHQAGDQVLKSFADILRKRCEDSDILCRIGGDEFLVCMEHELEEDAVLFFVEYLNSHIISTCQKMLGQDFNIPIGVSVGAVRIPPEGGDYEELFALADQALYRSKQRGKHGYSFYREENSELSDEIMDPHREFMRMLTILKERGALQNAMTVGQDSFVSIYRFMARFALRHKFSMAVCMLILTKARGVEEDAFLKEGHRFRSYLQSHLRRNDVILEWQHNTLFLMLPGLPEENTRAFVDRVMDEWEAGREKPLLHIAYFFDC